MVGLHHHAVCHLNHLHAGAALDQLGEQAFVVWVQVLHQHKGHAGVNTGGHAGEKSLNRRQATGRSADADNRKTQARDAGQCGCSGGYGCEAGRIGFDLSA